MIVVLRFTQRQPTPNYLALVHYLRPYTNILWIQIEHRDKIVGFTVIIQLTFLGIII